MIDFHKNAHQGHDPKNHELSSTWLCDDLYVIKHLTQYRNHLSLAFNFASLCQ
jgi:hypothetical protein